VALVIIFTGEIVIRKFLSRLQKEAA
jgi:hypothetical protein